MLRRALAVFALLLCAPFVGAQGAVTLLDTDITTPVTARTTPAFPLPKLPIDAPKYIAAQARFTYGGSGGTNATAYVQTSIDAGLTWIDIMSFQFTTATAAKVSSVVSTTALTPGTTPTDGSLTANTIVSGLIGDRLRVKYTTTGTYAGVQASGSVVYENATDISPGVLATQTVGYQNGTNISPSAAATNTVGYQDATPPSATKVLNIQGVVYTFVAVVAAAGDVKIEATADATMLNLQRCINKSGGTEGAGQDYMSAGGVAHPDVTASNNAGTDTLTLTAILPGEAGNSLALSSPAPNTEPTFTLGGALFSGGEESKRLVVNGVTYTFVATVASAGDVKIGADSDATMLNLQRCIMKSGGTEGAGQDYMSAGGVAHPTVTASNNAGTDTLTLAAKTLGLGGNAYTLASPAPYTEPTFTLGGALFSGGEESRKLTIGSTVYTFVTSVAVAGDVLIAGTSDGTMLNLQRCINKSGGNEGIGQDYLSAGGVAHPLVSAALNSGTDTLAITALLGGTTGNSIALTNAAPYTEATFTLSGNTLANGTTAAAHLKVTVLPR